MRLPRSAAEVLKGHVVLEIEGIDRMYLNMYVPHLQRELGVVGFFRTNRGYPMTSGALMSPITQGFVRRIESFAEARGLPMVIFEKGQRKEDIARERREALGSREGIYLVGKAQEKAHVWRTETRRDARTGARYPWILWSTAMVNHYYFYGVDDDFGPFFVKFCSYFPYTGKLCINGHEYLKRQLEKRGIGYEALDNGILSCAEPQMAQTICDGLSGDKIEALARKWLRLLPHPFSRKDRQAGYRYEVSILQAEFALTQVLDVSLSGRVFFEDVIRQNLDLGRPDQVALIFDRRITRRTPSRYRTRVVTQGVTPSLHVDYKHSRIKQYHKEGRALRTETTINDPWDFDVGKRPKNLPRMREVGFGANRRLLEIQRLSCDRSIGETAFAEMQRPAIVHGQRVSALRFGEPRTQALLGALASFGLNARAFTAAEFKPRLAQLLDIPRATLSQGRLSYELRRLRHRGLIERLPKTHRYRVTPFGLRAAVFYSRLHSHLFQPALSTLMRPDVPNPSRLCTLFNAIDQLLQDQARRLAA
jgi:hypothetical protein